MIANARQGLVQHGMVVPAHRLLRLACGRSGCCIGRAASPPAAGAVGPRDRYLGRIIAQRRPVVPQYAIGPARDALLRAGVILQISYIEQLARILLVWIEHGVLDRNRL